MSPYPVKDWPRWLRACLWLSLALHLLAAWRSVGFHHPDEHFQILEWINFSSGNIPADALAWEFHSKIRAWLLPLFLSLPIRLLQALGLDNPFDWAVFTRLLTTAFSFAVTLKLATVVPTFIHRQKSQWAAVFALLLTWFFPYLHARASSEQWGAIAFWSGWTILLPAFLGNPGKVAWQKMAGVGFLFGLSFAFRFQMAFAVAAMVIAYLFTRPPASRSAALTLGFFFSLLMLLMADRTGYGSWENSAWNYFRINLMEGKAAQFGVSPWWKYLEWIVLSAAPPFGLLALATSFSYWWKNWRSPLALATWPFLLAHLFIGHKELRFLFPLHFAMPLLLGAWLDGLSQPTFTKIFQHRPLIYAFIALNLTLALIQSTRPAAAEVVYLEAIQKRKIDHLVFVQRDPFELAGLRATFYNSHRTQSHKLDSLTDLPAHCARQGGSCWLHWEGLYRNVPGLENCSAASQSLPSWLRGFYWDRLWQMSRTRVMTLYQCGNH